MEQEAQLGSTNEPVVGSRLTQEEAHDFESCIFQLQAFCSAPSCHPMLRSTTYHLDQLRRKLAAIKDD